tara:strand:+ start:3634 stop:4263 length:630 start_codon:yes stop_codon:yes gene_type:complete
MSDKLKPLEIKKLLNFYESLLIEEEDIQSIIEDNKLEFQSEVKKLMGENESSNELKNDNLDINKDIKEIKGCDNIEEKDIKEEINKEDSHVNESTKSPINKTLKNIFREIVKKTHPDKTNSEELIDIYIKSKELYDKEDFLGLIYNCKILNIKPDLTLDDVKSINKSLNNKREEIYKLKKTWVYIWATSENKKEKESKIKMFCKTYYKK